MISDSGHYARVHTIFEAARALPDGERAERLAELCGGDTGLQSEVEELLALTRHDTPQPFAQVGIHDLRGDLEGLIHGLEPVAGVPKQVAKYRIEGPLGAGGMGVVYRAVQESPRRTVALKVLRPGSANPERLHRFRREAELLGRLQHSGIAQIHEAGTFDLGRGPQPFFAMELVDGVDLLHYSTARKLPQLQRLELAARVCDAIQHAHDQGVVHRDLKPDNILVDASGQPKVLDFGIARATEGSEVLTTLVTEDGDLLGTLAYMAPEQLEGISELITPRVDVFALGAIVFELLSGRLPRDLVGLPLAAAIELARESDPPLLGRLRPELRGDLETIVQKALEREPSRRYATPADLAQDLRSVLASRPIAARPPSRFYRAVKYARRNRALVTGTLTTLSAALIGLAVSIGFAQRASENAERARAGEQRARAGVLQAAQGLIERGEFARAAELEARLGVGERTWEGDLLKAVLPEVLPAPFGTRSLAWIDSTRLACVVDGDVVVVQRGTWSVLNRFEFGDVQTLVHESGLVRALTASDWIWIDPDRGEVVERVEVPRIGRTWLGKCRRLSSGELVTVRMDPSGSNWTVERNGLPPVVLTPPPHPESSAILTEQGDRVYVLMPEAAACYDSISGLRTGFVEGLRRSSCKRLWVNADQSRAFAPATDNSLLELDGSTLARLDVHEVHSGHECDGGNLSPDGAWFAVDTGTRIALTELATGTTRWLDKPAGDERREQCQFSPSGELLLAMREDIGARIVDQAQPELRADQLFGPKDPRCITFSDHTSVVHELAVSQDGRMVASLSPPDSYLRVWDADTGKRIADLPKPHGTLAHAEGDLGYQMAFSSDGRRLLATLQEGNGRPSLWSWDFLTGTATCEPLAPGLSDRSYLTLLDQFLVALGPGSASRLGRSAIRIPRGLGLVAEVPTHPELPDGKRWSAVPFTNRDQGLAVDPTGRQVALAATRQTVIHDLDSWDELRLISGQANCVDWSPIGRLIAAGDLSGRVRLIDAEQGLELINFEAHSEAVHCLAWTPDGTRLITGSLDGKLRVWDPRSPVERAADREPYDRLLGELRTRPQAELERRLPEISSPEVRMGIVRVLLERNPGVQPADTETQAPPSRLPGR